MRLTLGSRSYDLTTRALVLAARDALGDPMADGADLVEEAHPRRSAPQPTYAPAADLPALERAVAAGAALVRLPEPSERALLRCAAASVAVVVPRDAVAAAVAAGLAGDRIVPDTLVVDVTDAPCPVAATAVAVVRGARIVRTTEVRGARRVCDVLAAVMEAR